MRHRSSRDQVVIAMAHLRLVSGLGKSRRRLKASSLEEIRRKWQYFSGPVPVRINICGPEEELPEELRAIVEATGAAQVISRGMLLDLCGQRSKEEGGSCDASLVQSVCKDLALSQEDDPQAPADQVRDLCDNRKLAIPCEVPVRFKSSVGYNSKNTYLDSFQTKSGSSSELLALVRRLSQKERTRCKYQQQFVFRYGVKTSVRKQPTRPTKFKLAYAQNASSRDKVKFGVKSCKKAKIYHKKSNDKFWNPCTYIIMCISMICIYLTKQVNKCNLVGCQQAPAVSLNYMQKLKWPQKHARWLKNIMINQMVISGIYMDT